MEIQQGTKTIAVKINSTIEIRADAGFSLYGLEGKDTVFIFPVSPDARHVKYRLPQGVNAIKVKTSDKTHWTIQEHANAGEVRDSTPMAITLPEQKPRTLKEEIAQYFNQAFQAMNYGEQEHGHPESMELDDFEDDDFRTEYTIPDDYDERLQAEYSSLSKTGRSEIAGEHPQGFAPTQQQPHQVGNDAAEKEAHNTSQSTSPTSQHVGSGAVE